MEPIRITSVAPPFDSALVARRAAETIARAEGMGLLENFNLERLDLPEFRKVVDRIAAAGIGREALVELAGDLGEDDVAQVLARLLDALEASPVPRYEWRSLLELFGAERLAELTGTSPASVRRYAGGDRRTPDPIAARLHFLATVVGDLAGSYNEFGIRRWFERPRTALDGAAPGAVLADDWSPDDPPVRRVRELAASLLGSPAT